GTGHRTLTTLDDKSDNLLATTIPIPNPAVPGMPTPDRPIAARIQMTDPPLHPPRPIEPETPTILTHSQPQDDLPLALRQTPQNTRATPALTAAWETLATEATARDAGEEWATNNEPHQALNALSDTHTFAYLTLLNANVDKSSDSYIPRHYGKALQCLNLWREPMDSKLDILKKKGVWDLVDKASVPSGKKAINCM
ncbi:hypothetical protein C0991_002823, partial [Blastosporella zonata]